METPLTMKTLFLLIFVISILIVIISSAYAMNKNYTRAYAYKMANRWLFTGMSIQMITFIIMYYHA